MIFWIRWRLSLHMDRGAGHVDIDAKNVSADVEETFKVHCVVIFRILANVKLA